MLCSFLFVEVRVIGIDVNVDCLLQLVFVKYKHFEFVFDVLLFLNGELWRIDVLSVDVVYANLNFIFLVPPRRQG